MPASERASPCHPALVIFDYLQLCSLVVMIRVWGRGRHLVSLYLYSDSLNFLAILQRVDAELGMGWLAIFDGRTFVQSECRRVPAFREARRAGIHEKHIAEVLFELPDVRVAVQIHINLRLLRSFGLRLL